MESTTDMQVGWARNRAVQKEYPVFYQIFGGAALVALGILLGAAIFAQDEGYATNLYTEILSIGVTVFILNTLAERRAEQREEARRIRELKTQLVRDVKSQSNEAAKRAVDDLRQRGWLTGEDSLLKGEYLSGANLKEAYLQKANLQFTNFFRAKMQGIIMRGANLYYSNLRRSKLEMADLQYADLRLVDLFRADLENTKLRGANLEEADLRFANLKGASLREANLKNAELMRVKFDRATVMPDGEYWSQDTQLARFTDPEHPNFWRSDDPHSPAYRGDDPDPQ